MQALTKGICLGAAVLLTACEEEPETLLISGETMGTTYNITVIDKTNALDLTDVQIAVEATLATVNSQMSNWDPNSEISQFNTAQTTDPVEISPELSKVMNVANDVHTQSDGQFDVTLGPLIELWGFGARNSESPVPPDAAISAALDIVGQSKVLSLAANPDTMSKARPDTSVYLAAIAKGYGVDEVGATLGEMGITDYMVEIGGDLFAAGENASGFPWRIGIERPEGGGRTLEQTVRISGLGMATSGDYRNYFEENGVRYSHIIDANTGRPITHMTSSVTVLAEDAMLADAWATALLALGQDRGMEIAKNLDLAALFIVRDARSDETQFTTTASPRFVEISEQAQETE